MRENKWLAARHGVNADLIAGDTGERKPAELLLERARRPADAHRPASSGATDELADVLDVWATGPSYLRQRPSSRAADPSRTSSSTSW